MTRKESDDMMSMPSKLPASVYDPNPLDVAEYSLTLTATMSVMIGLLADLKPFTERMHDLYNGGCPKVIIDHCITELRDNGQSTIYVGTLKQCVVFISTFKEMGFGAQYTEIKL